MNRSVVVYEKFSNGVTTFRLVIQMNNERSVISVLMFTNIVFCKQGEFSKDKTF